MKDNFLASLSRALSHSRGHFLLSRVLLDRLKKEASRSLGLDNRSYKLIILVCWQADISIISKIAGFFLSQD